MEIRDQLLDVMRRVSRPGRIPEGAFDPIPADKLISALDAETLMNKTAEECSDAQIASALAIVTVCTLHQGGHDSGQMALAVERLLERLEEVERSSREHVRKSLEGFRTQIGASLSFGIKPKQAA